MVIEIRAKGLNAHWRSRVLNVLLAQKIIKFIKLIGVLLKGLAK